jgi:long-chain fatty acid transport protein
MKLSPEHWLSAAVAMLVSNTALAGALEQSNQSIQLLFEEHNYAELGWSKAWVDAKGTDLLGVNTGDVGPAYGMGTLGVKLQLTPDWSAALLVDQPFGITVNYSQASPLYAGTAARIDSTAATALLRYKFNANWSLYAGPRVQWLNADVALGGLAADVFSGYKLRIDRETGLGYAAGASYELPEIALRIALTYNAEISYASAATEVLPEAVGGPVAIQNDAHFRTPQSVNLDFQTGIAENTLLFGLARWVDWSAFELSPSTFSELTGEPLAGYPNDISTYLLGVAYQLTTELTLASTLAFEDERNRYGSALGPVNGFASLGVGSVYNSGPVRLSLSVAYYQLRDTDPVSADTITGQFRDNSLTAVELKMGYKF